MGTNQKITSQNMNHPSMNQKITIMSHQRKSQKITKNLKMMMVIMAPHILLLVAVQVHVVRNVVSAQPVVVRVHMAKEDVLKRRSIGPIFLLIVQLNVLVVLAVALEHADLMN